MARIASQSKGGFYPTPPEELQLIMPHLTFTYSEEETHLNLLDPCCGAGYALNDFKNHIKSQIEEFSVEASIASYGVELEETRAEIAATVLDHVVHEGYETVRTEDKFGMMWLNPPYDEMEGERFELRFLKTLTSTSKNVLQRGGLLLFCIPQQVLHNTAAVLSQRFTDIDVYRFTDAHFDEFNQVVVFAYLGKSTPTEQRETIQRLKELAKAEPSELPTLAEIDKNYIIPAHKEPVETFRAGKFNIKEIERDLLESPVFFDFEQRISETESRAIMKRPVLPLKSTHAGIAVASGAIGGNLGTHIVSGVTKQMTEVTPMYNDEGKHTGDKVLKYYNSAVRAFTPGGVYELN